MCYVVENLVQVLSTILFAGEIIENNGLMTKRLQRRLARYKDGDDTYGYLLKKTERVTNLSESSNRTVEESSDDGISFHILVNSKHSNFFYSKLKTKRVDDSK